ncbi:MAG: hypothetical protein Kow0075_06420 [Salibacteraceae bacterium]
MRSHLAILICGFVLTTTACDRKGTPGLDLVFNPSEDVALGQQLHEEIFANPDEYPLLDETAYADQYAYLQNLCDKIVATGNLAHADLFTYKVYIIDQDVLNAFAAPGGNLYFYTGLLKFLDEEDDVMGVMGHEIAHADRRHSVNQMLKNYGVQFMLSAALGNDPSSVAVILAQLAGTGAALKFSRSDESEADEYSVIYLSETEYRCDAAARFFLKLDSAGLTSNVPEFLSTHPSPDNRIEAIEAKAEELQCSTQYYAPASFYDFQASLP